MTTNKSEPLLQKAQTLYNQRMLPQALPLAQRALEEAQTENNKLLTAEAQLLTGCIYYTQASYSAEKMPLEKAEKQLEKARETAAPLANNALLVRILIAQALVCILDARLKQAQLYLSKAFQFSQQHQPESRILACLAMSRMYEVQNDFSKALDYAEKGLSLLKKKNLPESNSLKAGLYNQLGQVYIKQQEFSKILPYSTPAIQMSQQLGEAEKELDALKNTAIAYGASNDYKTAMQYFLQALDKSKSLEYHKNTAQCLINIGTIYAQLFNYKDALDRYHTVLEKYQHILDDNTLAIIYNNVGNIYYDTQRPEQAETYFLKALQLAKASKYREMTAHSLAQLGRATAARKNYTLALRQANDAQKLIESFGDFNGKPINLINLGNIHYRLGKPDEAIALIEEGIAAAVKVQDDLSQINGHQLLAEIFRQQKNFEKALHYQMIFSDAKERFSKKLRNRQIIDLEIKHAIQEKQKEIELLTKENEYQAILLEQSSQIARQNEQLLEANEELRQFAYVASHDLKEPLRMIGSYTHLVRRKYASNIDDESAAFFGFIAEGVARMNDLLDALLQYATIGKAIVHTEMVALKDVVDICVIHLKVAIEEAKAVVQVPENMPAVASNQQLLIQLLQNLIGNAIKFSKSAGQPLVEVSAWENNGEVIVKVKDNGIGIAPEFQERIFVIFQRLNARHKYSGTGMGLAICQKIAKLLGGRIWVESELRKGAEFYFAIPAGGPKKTAD